MESLKVLEYPGVKITLGRLSAGASLERQALIRRFLTSTSEILTPEEADLRTMQWNLICFAGHTRSMEGVSIDFPHRSDSDDEFDAKMARFLELDQELIDLWIEAVNQLSKPLVPRTQLPAELLTEGEKKTQTSNRKDVTLSKKSGRSSTPVPLQNLA